MSSDGAIEVHFDPNRGHLVLGCEADAFERFRDFAAQEAVLHSLNIQVGRVTTIVVFDASQRSAKSINVGWGDRIALAGCALASFVLLSLLAAGVSQVVDWFRG